jgi:NADH-quinone oxidoreductase subunit C
MPDVEIVQSISARLKVVVPEAEARSIEPNRLEIQATPDLLSKVGSHLKETENFDHVISVTGIDFPDKNQIRIIYHLGSYSESSRRGIVISLCTDTDRADPRIPSLTSTWPSAEYHERETHEMLGVLFEGHGDLASLLLPEDWSDIPPLRRDFKLRGR